MQPDIQQQNNAKYVEQLTGEQYKDSLQKSVLLGTPHIIRRVL